MPAPTLRSSQLLGALLGIPLVFTCVALVAVLTAPDSPGVGLFSGFWAASALTLKYSAQYFGWIVALQVVVAVASWARPRRPDLRRLLLVAVVAASLAMAAVSYGMLTRYGLFRQYPPFLVTWVGLGLLAAWSHTAHAKAASRRHQLALGITATLGFVALLVFHSQAPRYYPTLHIALLSASLVMGYVAYSLTGGPDLATNHARWSIGLLVTLSAALAIGTGVGWTLDRDAPAHTYFLSETYLGQGGILQGVDLGPTACATPANPLADAEAVQVFLDRANLPVLDDPFDLSDYNVLFVVSESVRQDHTALTDAPTDLTPSLQQAAASGAFVFRDAHAPSTSTIGTLASLFSMTYPSHAPVLVDYPPWHGTLGDEAVTPAELLQRAGYRTFAVVHDWALTCCIRGLSQGFETTRYVTSPDPVGQFLSDVQIADETIEAIGADSGRPFFGWVFFVSPHAPNVVPDRPDLAREAAYREEIRHVDAQFGRIWSSLERAGLLDETIVIFTADHGEELGEHGAIGHSSTVYAESSHVPLVVWIPGVTGSHRAEPVSTLHVLPWLFLNGPDTVRDHVQEVITRDLAPMMRATGASAVVELIGFDRMKTALIGPRSHVVFDFYSGRTLLFDRAADPLDQDDLMLRSPTASLGDLDPADALRAYRAQRACREQAVLAPSF